MICPIHNQEYAQCGHLDHKEETKVTEEKWFKDLPFSERIIWLRIMRNQIIDNLKQTIHPIYQPNYERDYSHSHCWNQDQPPACGIPLEKHTQCCLCDTPYNLK